MTLSWLKYLDDGRTLWTTVFEAIVQALRNKFVVDGCEVTASTTDLSVDVAAGNIMYEETVHNVSATNLALAAAETNKDRLDVVVWDYNGGSPVLKVLTGARWLTDADGNYIPQTERLTDEQIPLAIVRVPAGASVPSDVYDVRVSSILMPESDVKYVIGAADRRLKALYVRDAYIGDAKLLNGWSITEKDDDGEVIDGVRILDDGGVEIFKVTRDGLWFRGRKIA